MSMEGMGPSLAVEGATTSAVFEMYVERVSGAHAARRSGGGHGQPFRPQRRAHKGAHRAARLRTVVPAVLLSLDLNPIEEAFSKIKGLLRKAETRSREALLEAIGAALSVITDQDARGFFEHCGYHTMVQSF